MIGDKKLEDIRKAQFIFDKKHSFLALYTNPFYFVRKNLYKNILYFQKAMRGRVLDYGCGAKPYKELFRKCSEYVGCDIEVSGHDHNNEQIDVYYDGNTLPFKENEFDSVFSSEVFEHVSNLDHMLSELNRVLKPGGYMLVTIPFVWNEHEVPYDFRRLTSFGAKDLLEKHGFKVIQMKKSTSHVEMVFQMRMEYIRKKFENQNRSRRIIAQRVLIAPITLVGVILADILPKEWSLFGDNIILCKKM